jgi:hypothetical protein
VYWRIDPVCRCRLLATPDIEAAVRVGDVYALLTEWHFSKQEFEQALKMIQGMQKRYYTSLTRHHLPHFVCSLCHESASGGQVFLGRAVRLQRS